MTDWEYQDVRTREDLIETLYFLGNNVIEEPLHKEIKEMLRVTSKDMFMVYFRNGRIYKIEEINLRWMRENVTSEIKPIKIESNNKP